MQNKKLLYAGIGAFALLVFYFSTRKSELKEVSEETAGNKNFDHSSLPSHLKPPYMMRDGETFESAIKQKSLTGISFKQRFDR